MPETDLNQSQQQGPDTSMRRTIVAGVLSSALILYFVDPLLGVLARGTLWTGSRLWSGALDAVYSSAALGHRNDLAVFFLTFSAALPAGALAGVALFTMSSRRRASGPPSPRKLGRVVAPLIGALAVLAVGGLFMATMSYMDLQLTTSFAQRMTVLAPHLSEQEEEELRARWASMTSQEDYLLLQQELERVSAERGVALPRPLI